MDMTTQTIESPVGIIARTADFTYYLKSYQVPDNWLLPESLQKKLGANDLHKQASGKGVVGNTPGFTGKMLDLSIVPVE
jgi:hypothetical protein